MVTYLNLVDKVVPSKCICKFGIKKVDVNTVLVWRFHLVNYVVSIFYLNSKQYDGSCIAFGILRRTYVGDYSV
jgi:hypothetical protein